MIVRDRSRFGGCFTSELKWGGSHINRQWFDFYFVGPDRFSIWNAQISTAHREFWCEVEDLAFCRTAELLSADELTRNFAYRSEPS